MLPTKPRDCVLSYTVGCTPIPKMLKCKGGGRISMNLSKCSFSIPEGEVLSSTFLSINNKKETFSIFSVAFVHSR